MRHSDVLPEDLAGRHATDSSGRVSALETVRGRVRWAIRAGLGERGEASVHRRYHAALRRIGQFAPPEDAETLAVLHLLAAGARTILDVGANTGRYAHLFLQAVPSDATLHAFEPLPGALSLLRSNVAGDTRARVHALALGDEDGRAEIAVPPDALGNPVSALAHLDAPAAGEARLAVEVRRLDSLVASGEIVLALPVLAKIDVEGHEAAVLAGAAALLKARAAIYFESQDDHLVRAGGRSPWPALEAAEYVVLARTGPGWLAARRPTADSANYLAVPQEVFPDPGDAVVPQSVLVAALAGWVTE